MNRQEPRILLRQAIELDGPDPRHPGPLVRQWIEGPHVHALQEVVRTPPGTPGRECLDGPGHEILAHPANLQQVLLTGPARSGLVSVVPRRQGLEDCDPDFTIATGVRALLLYMLSYTESISLPGGCAPRPGVAVPSGLPRFCHSEENPGRC